MYNVKRKFCFVHSLLEWQSKKGCNAMGKRKPLIGLVPLVDEERDSYWMLPGYMKGVELAGGVPVMLPLTADTEAISRIADAMDGFILTGGHDVDPALYGEVKLPECVVCCDERDAMVRILFPLVLEKGKSVLGICRGLQLMNALLGGTLYQDLPTQHPSDICHRQSAPYDKPVHSVCLVESSPLSTLLGKAQMDVNSCHHQAIKRLAPGFEAMAYSPDGLVEAACMPARRFAWGLQWHPEFAYKVSGDSVKIFEAFVRSMMN